MPYKRIADKRRAFRRWYERNKRQHIRNVKRRESERRKEYKRRLVKYLGGACSSCGYDACPQALDFHHEYPADKTANVSALLRDAAAWKKVRAEARKCVLLCANCHREHHHAK